MQQNSPEKFQNTNSSIEHLLNASKIAFLTNDIKTMENKGTKNKDYLNAYRANYTAGPESTKATDLNKSNAGVNSQTFTPSIFKNSEPSMLTMNTNTDVSRSNSIDAENHKVVLNPVKRKRLRKIKSCKFCYRRHLKCDKLKPICSVCLEKGYKECLYYREDEIATLEPTKKKKKKKASHSESINSTTLATSAEAWMKKNELIYETIDTEDKKEDELGVRKQDSLLTSIQNPLLKNPTLMCKDERILFFGPTCFRSSVAIISKSDSVLNRFFKAWDLFKKERSDIRKTTKFSLAKESKLLDYVSPEQNLLKDIVKVLPKSKQELKYYISLYFKSPLHEEIKILNEDTIMTYIDQVFETTEDSDEIVNIKFTNKRNYYKAAIVLALLDITFFETVIPECVSAFFVFLQGQTTGKMMYLEKVQFLLMRCFFLFLTGHTGGDFSHLVNLVGNLCNTMIELCLNNLNCENIYKNGSKLNHIVVALGGDFKILSRIFYLGMFVDVICSHYKGKPLFVSFDLYPNEWLLIKETPDDKNDELDCKLLNHLKLFLYHSRGILNEIYKPVGIPKLNGLLDDMLLFVHKDLSLNEMCYGDVIPNDKPSLNYCVIQSFLASFALELLIATLAIKRDYKFNDSIKEETDEKFFLETGNQIVYYCLCINQVSCYLSKCLTLRQSIFEQENKNLLLSENQKTIGCDKVLFFLFFSPKFSVQMRVFSEFFKVLFCTRMMAPDAEGSCDYIEKQLEEDRMILNKDHRLKKDLSKDGNSVGLREFVMETDILANAKKQKDANTNNEYYFLSKLYPKFHPALFQNRSLNENLSKIKFTGLQLYGWFTMLHDEQAVYDEMIKDQTIQFKLQMAHLKAKEKFARTCFTTFLEGLKEQRDKKMSIKSQNLLRQTFDNSCSRSNSTDATTKPTGSNPFTNMSSLMEMNSIETPNLNTFPSGLNFDLTQRGLSLNSPNNKLGRSNSNILENITPSPMFNWDMNFIDFSSKMNWFLQSPLTATNMDDNEINILTSSIEKSNNESSVKDNADKDMLNNRNNELMNFD